MGGTFKEAQAASQAAAAASVKAKAGPALFDRDAAGRMGFAYQLDAAEAHRTAARMWRAIETTNKIDKATADHAADMVRLHRDAVVHFLSLVPTTLGGQMATELVSELELGRRMEKQAWRSMKEAEKQALARLKENPRYYSELRARRAGTSAEQLAAQALSELEAHLRLNPPAGTTSGDVVRLFTTSRTKLETELANLIIEAQTTPEERDLKLSSAAGRALRSLKPPRIARLAKIAQAGAAGFSPPYYQAPPQEAAAWTRELKNLSRWDLVVGDGWRWRLTPLGQRVLQLAQDKAKGSRPDD